jgi:hypothetical protein
MKRNGTTLRLTSSLAGALGLVTALAACTDTELIVVTPLGDELAVEGSFCTAPPLKLPVASRILFLMDGSNSMEQSDPEGKRFEAVRGVIEKYRDAPNVLFGVICWANSPFVVMDGVGFTKVEATLEGWLVACEDDSIHLEDTSNFVAALDEALHVITTDDVATGRVDYFIEFLTDGMPTAENIDDPRGTVDTVLAGVRAVREAAAEKGGGSSHVDTILFATEPIQNPGVFVTLLPDMARTGGGKFIQVDVASDVVDALRVLTEVDTWIQNLELRELFVSSGSVLVDIVEHLSAEVALYLDIDGDGLADPFEEEVIGTSPASADTDADGVGDLVEYRLRGTRDPLASEPPPSDLPDNAIDGDGDGLNGAEESLLALDAARPDSDDDGIPDGLEVRARLDPIGLDHLADYDDDGISNIDELRQHTNPRIDEGPAFRAEHAYRYGDTAVTERADGRTCYTFSVGHLKLVETPAVPGEEIQGGRNEINVVFTDKPVAVSPAETHSACQAVSSVIFRDGVRDPNRVSLELPREAFCN